MKIDSKSENIKIEHVSLIEEEVIKASDIISNSNTDPIKGNKHINGKKVAKDEFISEAGEKDANKKKNPVLLKRFNSREVFLNSDYSNTTDDAESFADLEELSKAKKKKVRNNLSGAKIFKKMTSESRNCFLVKYLEKSHRMLEIIFC